MANHTPIVIEGWLRCRDEEGLEYFQPEYSFRPEDGVEELGELTTDHLDIYDMLQLFYDRDDPSRATDSLLHWAAHQLVALCGERRTIEILAERFNTGPIT